MTELMDLLLLQELLLLAGGECANDRKRKAGDDGDETSRSFFTFAAATLVLTNKRTPFRDCLDAHGRLRRSRKLPRCAVVEPRHSPWQRLHDSGHDGALITVTGHDFAAFRELLLLFAPLFNMHSPWTGYNDGATYKLVQKKRGGRPRKTTAASCLGLVLAWCRFTGSEFILQGWFGFTGTPVNVWLRFGRRMLLKALSRNAKAQVRMPSEEKTQQCKALTQRKHPALKNICCVADGLKLPFQSTFDDDAQGQFYNGWTHGHCTTNLLVFGPDGRMILCIINAPGSVHDSTLADWGGTHDKLESVCNANGGICCLDSAFQAIDADYLIKSSNDEHGADTPEQLCVNVEATKLRQAAEWGMRAMQGSFPRTKETLRHDENPSERQVHLKLLCLLCNFRLETVGLNQIRNVYVPEWGKDADFIISNS